MIRKNIYFTEVGFSFDSSVYLPYATGTIAAYLKTVPGFSEKYNIADFIFRRESVKAVIEKMAAPFVVAFSCSIWNWQFNLKVAEELKKQHPDVKIIFGGHNVSPDNNLLRQYPFIDYCMYGEGERNFYNLLTAIETGDNFSLTDVSFRDGSNYFFMPRTKPQDVADLPSPYLAGVFDEILRREPDTDFLTVMETNRGCPYSCAYCDWCSGKKVRLFPMEKILAEIRWLSDNKIEYTFCADSNFGLFERDVEIARALAESKIKTGYPRTFRPCYAKNNDKTVFEICTILNGAKMDKGATFAYQSLSEDALANINRKNLTLEHFSHLLAGYTANGIPTYSELILGLPGETRQSFCEGICRLLESGQHNSLSVYHCEMLPNSIMSTPSYVAKHKIKAIDVAFNHIHSEKKQEEVEEFSHIVQSTATLSREDWIYCNLFAVTVQCFHALGLTRFIAVYLNKAQKVPYIEFYSGLLDFIMKDGGSIGNLFRGFEEKLRNSLAGDWNYVSPSFGKTTWTFEEGAFLELSADTDGTFEALSPFINRFFDNSDIESELVSFQKCALHICGKGELTQNFNYGFARFFEAAFAGETPVLESKPNRTLFSSDNYYTDAATYAKEVVWYGRRRGQTICRIKQTEK